MKFAKVRRQKLKRAKIIRRMAEVCPWCGAVESMRSKSTQRRGGKIYRYSVCTKCGNPVTREISLCR